jgi:hypothetical protein
MKSTKFKYLSVNIIIIYLIFAVANIVYPLDKISFNQQTENVILVTSKMDLTKLPRGEIYKVVHDDFVLQFFFNNRDIFGYIFKRKPSIGIKAHLCLYRSCEDTSYDLRKVIAKPFEPPFDKSFFSVKFPQKLQYKFQGLEFLPHK